MLPLERLGRSLGLHPRSAWADPGPGRTVTRVVTVRPGTTTAGGSASLRAEIERVGVDEFAGLCDVVASSPSPGHPAGLHHALLDPPAPWRGRCRLLHAPNGTRHPATGRFAYVLVVVGRRHRTPTAAAAASYGISEADYAALANRT